MTLLVHINGWPGSGKLTIARLLAKRLGGRLIDNHTLINPAECLLARDDPNYWALRRAVRELVLGYAAQLPSAIPIVLTDALADIDSDRATFDDCRGLASKRGAELIAVVLACDPEENARRLASAGRAELRKLTRVPVLRELRATYELLRPAGVTCIDLDVTALPPAEAAAAIHSRCAQPPAAPGVTQP